MPLQGNPDPKGHLDQMEIPEHLVPLESRELTQCQNHLYQESQDQLESLDLKAHQDHLVSLEQMVHLVSFVQLYIGLQKNLK